MILHLIADLALFLVMVPWYTARMLRPSLRRGGYARFLVDHISAELRPFVPPAIVLFGAYLEQDARGPFDRGMAILIIVIWVWNWATDKDDDDRWRRRRRKLRERLTVQRRQLVTT